LATRLASCLERLLRGHRRGHQQALAVRQGRRRQAHAPGAFWFQPGGSAATAHGDECLSDSCVAFIYMMPGKFDFTPAAPAKK
jgi:hypothetical protein